MLPTPRAGDREPQWGTPTPGQDTRDSGHLDTMWDPGGLTITQTGRCRPGLEQATKWTAVTAKATPRDSGSNLVHTARLSTTRLLWRGQRPCPLCMDERATRVEKATRNRRDTGGWTDGRWL